MSASADIDKAVSVVDAAIAFVDQTGERFYHADLLRLKGELIVKLHGSRGQDGARQALEQAVVIAREPGRQAARTACREKPAASPGRERR